ncbi:hypothetical protein PQI66_09965 [Corynebacterium sp. USCH3]|uniref:hypothetical protein n=1 Tax=Corynebacterium sp. USCH3 TaxID=3024840 RepID=UPI003094CD91
MTRINDVAGIVRSYFKESEHYPNVWEDIAGSLDIAGHLMPDLPSGRRVGNEIEWRLNNCDEAIADDEGGLWIYDGGRMIPEEPMTLRARALIYLAAADYAEEHTNDQ